MIILVFKPCVWFVYNLVSVQELSVARHDYSSYVVVYVCNMISYHKESLGVSHHDTPCIVPLNHQATHHPNVHTSCGGPAQPCRRNAHTYNQQT